MLWIFLIVCVIVLICVIIYEILKSPNEDKFYN